MNSNTAVIVPGFGGSSNQPLLTSLSQALEATGVHTHRLALSKPGRRPSPGLATEVGALREACPHSSPKGVILIGRSFGGRVCTYLAAEASSPAQPRALVVLGYPIRPPNKTRPLDEAALGKVRCPTLIVQGEHDELGPVAVLREVTRANDAITLRVIKGAGHAYGSRKREREVVTLVTAWLLELSAKGSKPSTAGSVD